MIKLTIEQLRNALYDTPAVVYEDDFFVMDFTYRKGYDLRIKYPCKFEGVICIFCLSGEYDLTVGVDHYDLDTGSFAISLPGDIISLFPKPGLEGKIRILAVSEKFLNDIGIDAVQSQIAYRHRAVKLDPKNTLMTHHFRNLFRSIILNHNVNTSRALGMLVMTMNLELVGMWESAEKKSLGGSGKRSSVSDTFFALVSKYHSEYRDISFYANQLSLTPKYLSSLIKNLTGKTALEIITEHVMMEAKFYLSNTSMSIKQIAFELNFQSQVDFYRYFKRHQGVSPTLFRQSSVKE